ncbi:AraC family transcriptional regulator [Niabella sp.]|uniref:helix-turn-helix domain-containing protein n=1 Tax=Niabella sp. TaxID=1962976 RepID=UPI00260D5D66|nr:AraC family transcriptional regulator [Niabella sp.]
MTEKDSYPVCFATSFQANSDVENNVIYSPFQGANQIDTPQAHDFFVFMLFESGSGTHTIDFIDYEVHPYQIHFLFPGQLHQWQLGADSRGQRLIATKYLFEKFAATLQLSETRYHHRPVVDLSPESYQKTVAEFQLISQELMHPLPVSWEIVSLRIRLIFTLANRQTENEGAHSDAFSNNPVLLKFQALIEQHFREHKSVAFYAEQLHVTPNYLSILCKRNRKASAISLIQQKVILEAKKMMHTPGMSVKEIAYELGFNEIAYFSYFFKSKTGLSPRSYRKQIAASKA